MKRLRKIIFWCHLPIGVLGGVIILIMCVTGVLLGLEKQITGWVDYRSYRSAPPSPDAARLTVEALILKARESRNVTPTSVTLRSPADAPAEIGFGRETTVFVNPYSGQVLGEGSKRVRSFFRIVTDWHRWLGAQGEARNVARAITGACNLGFLFLIVSGFYLWWPQVWSRKFVRSVIWFRRGLPAKARDFNWHNVIGFWSALPLFVVVLSAVVISYTWAGNLVYRIVGEAPPAPRANPTTPGTSPRREPSQGADAFAGIDAAWIRAEKQTTDWRSITLQLPANINAPLTFAIDSGNGGQPQKRSQLTFNRASSEVTRWEPFSSQSNGRKLRSILRFAHTGEVAGLPGQIVATLVSGGGGFLVWTGLALAWRRLRGWLSRKVKASRSNTKSGTELISESAGD